jgi:hypothetical protein
MVRTDDGVWRCSYTRKEVQVEPMKSRTLWRRFRSPIGNVYLRFSCSVSVSLLFIPVAFHFNFIERKVL